MSYILGDRLGEGTYGEVFECELSDKKCEKKAIKCIDMKGKYKCLLEASIMSTYKHPYLAHAEDIVIDGDTLYIVQKLAKCDLAAISRNNPLLLSKVKKYVYCIAKGIHFLHSRKIIHGDLKASNILLYDKDIVKVADYSLSLITTRESYTHRVGTPTHKAPECFNNNKWSYPIDSWALGCTIYELAYGNSLIPKQKNKHLADVCYYNAIMSWVKQNETLDISTDHKVPFIDVKHSKLYYRKDHSVINDLIIKLTCYNPHRRLSMKDVLLHEFFSDNIVKDIPIVIKKREKWDITPKVMSMINKHNVRQDIKIIALNIISHCLDMKYDLYELSGLCIVLSYIVKKEEIPERFKKYNLTKLLESLNFSFHEMI